MKGQSPSRLHAPSTRDARKQKYQQIRQVPSTASTASLTTQSISTQQSSKSQMILQHYVKLKDEYSSLYYEHGNVQEHVEILKSQLQVSQSWEVLMRKYLNVLLDDLDLSLIQTKPTPLSTHEMVNEVKSLRRRLQDVKSSSSTSSNSLQPQDQPSATADSYSSTSSLNQKRASHKLRESIVRKALQTYTTSSQTLPHIHELQTKNQHLEKKSKKLLYVVLRLAKILKEKDSKNKVLDSVKQVLNSNDDDDVDFKEDGDTTERSSSKSKSDYYYAPGPANEKIKNLKMQLELSQQVLQSTLQSKEQQLLELKSSLQHTQDETQQLNDYSKEQLYGLAELYESRVSKKDAQLQQTSQELEQALAKIDELDATCQGLIESKAALEVQHAVLLARTKKLLPIQEEEAPMDEQEQDDSMLQNSSSRNLQRSVDAQQREQLEQELAKLREQKQKVEQELESTKVDFQRQLERVCQEFAKEQAAFKEQMEAKVDEQEQLLVRREQEHFEERESLQKQHQGQVSRLENKLQQQQDELTKLPAQVSELEQTKVALEQHVDELEQQLDQHQEQSRQALDKAELQWKGQLYSQLTQQEEVSQQRLEQERQAYVQREAKLQKQLDQALQAQESHQLRSVGTENDKKELETKVAALTMDLEAAQLDWKERERALQQELSSYQSQVVASEDQVQSFESQLQTHKLEANQLQSKLTESEDLVHQLETAQKDFVQDKERLEQEASELQNQLESSQDQVSLLEQRLADLAATEAERNAKILKVQDEIDTIKATAEQDKKADAETIASLERQMEQLVTERASAETELQSQVQALTTERDEARKKLESLVAYQLKDAQAISDLEQQLEDALSKQSMEEQVMASTSRSLPVSVDNDQAPMTSRSLPMPSTELNKQSEQEKEEYEKKISDLEGLLHEMSSSHSNALQEHQHASQALEDRLAKVTASLESDQQTFQTRIHELETELEATVARERATEERGQAACRDVEERLSAVVEALRTEKDQESKRVRELESELQSLSQQQQEALRSMPEQESRALEVNERREEDLNAQMQSLQEESKALEETLQSEITTLKEELTQCQKDMAHSTNLLFNLRQQNSQMTERNKDVIDRYEAQGKTLRDLEARLKDALEKERVLKQDHEVSRMSMEAELLQLKNELSKISRDNDNREILHKGEVADMSKQVSKLRSELETSKTEVSNLGSKNTYLDNQNRLLGEKLQGQSMELDSLQDQLDELSKFKSDVSENLSKEKSVLESEISEQQEKVNQLVEEFGRKESQHRAELSKVRIDALTAESDLKTEIKSMHKELNAYKSSLESSNALIKDLQKSYGDLNKRNQEYIDKLDAQKKDLRVQEHKIKQHVEKEQQAESKTKEQVERAESLLKSFDSLFG